MGREDYKGRTSWTSLALACGVPEYSDRPHVALAVRGAQRHLPTDEPAREVAGPHELRADRQRQLLLPVSDLS
jgi:hypothetical protein